MIDLRNSWNIECPRAKGAYLEDAPEEIWTEDGWVLEPKLDAMRVTMEIGVEGSLLVGRNRQDFLKGVAKAKEFRCQNLLNPAMARVAHTGLELTLLDGELTEVFKQDGTYDKGTMEREAEGMFVGYVVWTCLVWQGQDVRCLDEEKRRFMAELAVRQLGCPKIRLIEQLKATKKNLQKLFAKGYEGAIAKKTTMPVPVNQRTNPYWWKLKGDDERTVDAIVIGVTEAREGGSGIEGRLPMPNGKAASFVVGMLKGGKVVEVGKMNNLPEEAVEFGLKDFDRFTQRAVEMKASGWDGARFRFPRFVKWRPDKTVDDCLWEEQIGC